MMMYSCPCIQKSKFTFSYGVRPFLASHCVLSIVKRRFSQCGSVPGYRRSFVILLGALSRDKKEDEKEYLWKLTVSWKENANKLKTEMWSWLLIKEMSYFPAS